MSNTDKCYTGKRREEKQKVSEWRRGGARPPCLQGIRKGAIEVTFLPSPAVV